MKKLLIFLILSNTLLFSMSGSIQFSYLPIYGIGVDGSDLITTAFETKINIFQDFKNFSLSTESNTLMVLEAPYFAPFSQEYIITCEYRFKDITAGASHMCSHFVDGGVITTNTESCYNKLYIRYNF